MKVPPEFNQKTLDKKYHGQYLIMDGRVVSDFDDATVFQACDTLRESFQHLRDYGDLNCIVGVHRYEDGSAYLIAQDMGKDGVINYNEQRL